MSVGESNGGEEGIRTLDTGFSPYNGLANRRLQPLGHLSVGLHSDKNHNELQEICLVGAYIYEAFNAVQSAATPVRL